jgi:hypothetical protein
MMPSAASSERLGQCLYQVSKLVSSEKATYVTTPINPINCINN